MTSEDRPALSKSTTGEAIAEVRRWIDWANRVNGQIPCDLVVSSVVAAYGAALIPTGTWFPIESLPEGTNVLLYWPCGEKGNGGMECAMVFREGDDWSYWTHGGPNSGSDWEPANNEKPTHWMPLPEPPL